LRHPIDTITIPSPCLADLKAEASLFPEREVAGLLEGIVNCGILTVNNIVWGDPAYWGQSSFVLNGEKLSRCIEKLQEPIYGFALFHFHPSGDPTPSIIDLQQVMLMPIPSIIFCNGEEMMTHTAFRFFKNRLIKITII
jgi:hypothetical protein